MKIKYLIPVFLIILLFGCGSISEEQEESVINSISQDSTISEYLEATPVTKNELSKGDFNKELGVREYMLSVSVNEKYYKLKPEQQHYIAKRMSEKSPSRLECSGNKMCKITSVSLTFYDEDGELDMEFYRYYPDDKVFMAGTDFIYDYEEVN